MDKVYARINWENLPSMKTALGARNLNRTDYAINEIDNRVITLDTTKLNASDAQLLIKSVTFDRGTGVFTITHLNGKVEAIDTLLEKVIVNFDFNEETQQLTITLDDGTVKPIDLSAFITQYEFLDSDTISFFIDDTGKAKAIVKEGSIFEKHLRPDYLADIKVESASAAASAEAAAESEQNAADYALSAEESAKAAAESEGTASEKAKEASGSALAAKQSEEHSKESEESADASKKGAQNAAELAEKSAQNAAGSEAAAGQCAVSAAKSEADALSSAEVAGNSALESKSWARGDTGIREGEQTDNSKFWSEQSKSSSELSKTYFEKTEQAGKDAVDMINNAADIAKPSFVVDVATGHLLYEGGRFVFGVNQAGHLEWGLAL